MFKTQYYQSTKEENMTAQIGDIIKYKGKRYRIASGPLKQYLDKRNDIDIFTPQSNIRCSGCWRGYIAIWTITDF